MYRFIETIQLKEGKFLNLDYHQIRLEKTFRHFFPGNKTLNIQEEIAKHSFPSKGKYRCTFHYNKKKYALDFKEYCPKNISLLRIVNGDHLEYSWKYSERGALEELLKITGKNEDILILRNGLISDTSYTNVVFYDGSKWQTPSTPLLAGSKRHQLLEEGKIFEQRIGPDDLGKFSKCSMINAMLDIGEIEIDTTHIIKHKNFS